MGKKSIGDILGLITAIGDLLIGNGEKSLTKISKGNNGQILLVNSDGNVAYDNQMHDKIIAQINTDYTTAQMRNVIISTGEATGGNNGDIWIKYTA